MDYQYYKVYAAIAVGVLFFIFVFVVLMYRYGHAVKMIKDKNLEVKLNTKISSVNPAGGCGPNGLCRLRDYYIMGSYNSCIEGPYEGGAVSIAYLKNVIATGYRFLDFEIYSSVTDEPIVSCSTHVTDCGTDATTFFSIPFTDVMETIDTYAFTNSGCQNFKDPLIVNLRIKTCNVNIIQKLAGIFAQHSSRMLPPPYSFNANNHNFGDTTLDKLQNKICLFVDSSSVDYSSNVAFMEYVNSSTITGFLKEMTKTSFKNIPSLNDLKEYNKRNMTVILPDYKDPTNTLAAAYHEGGCQIVAMKDAANYSRDTYLKKNFDFFSGQYGSAFVLKPEALRDKPEVIDAPVKQVQANSYASRDLDTGVAGITLKI
jgi:hypothetical protein